MLLVLRLTVQDGLTVEASIDVFSAVEPIVSGSAIEEVVAVEAKQMVVAAPALDVVFAAACYSWDASASKDVASLIADKGVVLQRAGGTLDRSERVESDRAALCQTHRQIDESAVRVIT
jgi:hypothetical protein